jgi:hypothetical protein
VSPSSNSKCNDESSTYKDDEDSNSEIRDDESKEKSQENLKTQIPEHNKVLTHLNTIRMFKN